MDIRKLFHFKPFIEKILIVSFSFILDPFIAYDDTHFLFAFIQKQQYDFQVYELYHQFLHYIYLQGFVCVSYGSLLLISHNLLYSFTLFTSRQL